MSLGESRLEDYLSDHQLQLLHWRPEDLAKVIESVTLISGYAYTIHRWGFEERSDVTNAPRKIIPNVIEK